MIKKQLSTILALCLSSLGAQEKILFSTLNEFYNLFYLHENATFNQRLGDLKSYPLRNGFWLRSEFVEQITQENSNLLKSKTQSILTQFGYDYAFTPKGGKNFLGFNVDYAYSWLNISNSKGNAHSFGISLDDYFVSDHHFYISTALKYTMIYPTNFLSSNQALIHFFSAHLEIGQKFTFPSHFFIQPLVKTSLGFTPSLLFQSAQNTLETQNTMPLILKAGGYFGVDFWGSVKGDFRVGSFFDGDFFFFSSPTLDQVSLAQRENYRLNLELSTNIHVSKNFRFYFGAQTNFFGESNINYGVNLGMRFLFGKSTNNPPPLSVGSKRNLQSIQQNLRFEGDASIARVEAKTHLSDELVQEKYIIQEKRNSPSIQDDIKYEKRQRYVRESSQWIDIKKNEENYQNRNTPQMQLRDINTIRNYYQRELERKYGKE